MAKMLRCLALLAAMGGGLRVCVSYPTYEACKAACSGESKQCAKYKGEYVCIDCYDVEFSTREICR